MIARRMLLAGSGAMLATSARAGQPPVARRIVCLDYGLAQTVLTLGAVPVGLPDPAHYRAWVIDPPLPPGVADVGGRASPNLERLASLAPDAILTVPDQDPIAPQLAAIAPVLRLPIATPAKDPWTRSEAAARAIGTLLGREAAAQALIDGVARRYADARAGLGPMPPLLLASFLDPRHLAVYGAGSILGDALDRLGLRNAWQGPTGRWGSATVGLEALARMDDAALLAIEPLPPDLGLVLDASPLWNALPIVRAGRVLHLPPVLMYGTLPAADRFLALLLPRLRDLAVG